ncbi:hypothetical protein SCLCIDRAFT_1214714 [Scleroderma citrinum Foug A]|uniref:Uncharacterized protein n=1 Tax=Scleroderma citrinum Foug A TaxID=1036808 RepID=A0A0C3DQI2_9AGAM|nr:hypothetical protein SCLCIDRAFT_1214714 [Scleroderma citrinum Foug A]
MNIRQTTQSLTGCSISPDLVFSCSDDMTVKIWARRSLRDNDERAWTYYPASCAGSEVRARVEGYALRRQCCRG